MHFDLTISLGSILTFGSIMVLAVTLAVNMKTLVRKMDIFLVEHEILIADYCKRTGTSPSELPTRARRI
jgi:hypothetical protein